MVSSLFEAILYSRSLFDVHLEVRRKKFNIVQDHKDGSLVGCCFQIFLETWRKLLINSSFLCISEALAPYMLFDKISCINMVIKTPEKSVSHLRQNCLLRALCGHWKVLLVSTKIRSTSNRMWTALCNISHTSCPTVYSISSIRRTFLFRAENRMSWSTLFQRVTRFFKAFQPWKSSSQGACSKIVSSAKSWCCWTHWRWKCFHCSNHCSWSFGFRFLEQQCALLE